MNNCLLKNYWIYFLLLSGLFSCDLEKEIEVDIPAYDPQIVVECYLESQEPYRLTVIESSPFFAIPEVKVLNDANVTIARNGNPTMLRLDVEFDKQRDKLYTHSSSVRTRHRVGDIYTISVTDTRGRKITGTSTVLPKVLIDTIEYRYNDKGKAFLVTKFKDEGATQNYYRFSVHKSHLGKRAEVDYTAPDNLNNGGDFAFGTGYEFKKNDTVFVTLYHLEKAYFEFINSVEGAKDANGNPFAQPASVKSTVTGGLGVFTNLIYDRQRIILK